MYWKTEIPRIDDFGQEVINVFIDGKTIDGPWAIMSLDNFNRYGVGLGTGKGQLYVIKDDKAILKKG
jgi:hypothetical protein